MVEFSDLHELGCRTGHSREVHQSNVVLGSMPLLVLLDTKVRPFL